MIERTYRGVHPHVPVDFYNERCTGSMLSEHERLAYFEQSAHTRDGQVAPFPSSNNAGADRQRNS